MKKRRCLLCEEEGPLSREHRIKRSLLEYFNNFQNQDEDKVLKFNDGTDYGGEFSNIKEAKNLKPKKNICIKCNSERSQESDEYFHKFVVEEFHWQDGHQDIEKLELPSKTEVHKEMDHQRNNLVDEIDDTLWMNGTLFVNVMYLMTSKYEIYTHPYDEELIKKYLAKHTICYLDRLGIKASRELRSIFLNGTSLEAIKFKIYFLPKAFQSGYLNTMVKIDEKEYRYALIFSNLAIHVCAKK